ncbi:MAG: hypothetical protein RR420_00845 [Anaerovoracaceae bacterium]
MNNYTCSVDRDSERVCVNSLTRNRIYFKKHLGETRPGVSADLYKGKDIYTYYILFKKVVLIGRERTLQVWIESFEIKGGELICSSTDVN